METGFESAYGFIADVMRHEIRQIAQIENDRSRFVYVSSAYRGDTEGNVKKARIYCRFIVDHGKIPFAPHLLFPQFMDESTEREVVMGMNLELLKLFDELWVFGSRASSGMMAEVMMAQALGMDIRWFTEDLKEVEGWN